MTRPRDIRLSARCRQRAVLLTLMVASSLLGGCVYYNGMYNTNRLAKSARKAERDGRTFEANNLWGQVITRAESLVVRHPRSKYVDQANVLRGLALARLDQCPAAVGPLSRGALLDEQGDLTEEAALALGRCHLELGDAALADLALARVVDSHDPARRREARFHHARALRMTGRFEEGLAVMRDSPDPRSRNDRLLALAGAGRSDEALALADSLLASNDSAFAWDSAITALGRQDPRVASALVGRLQRDPRPSPELRARRLYEDAVRLSGVDSAASLARLRAAAGLKGRTESGELARLGLLKLALSGVRTLDELTPLADSVTALAGRSSAASSEAAMLDAAIARLQLLTDSAGPGAPRGDLHLFLGAEDARDGIRASALSATLFRRLADEWPWSPYAPKAILAAQQLDPWDAETARARLDSLYRESPYMAVLRGEDAPEYRVLEDSLEAFAAAAAPRARAPRPGARVRPVGPDDPGLRPGRPGRLPAEDDPPRPRRGLEP